MGPLAQWAHSEHILRDEGYDVFDIPRMHAAEVRRVFEGRAQERRIQEARQNARDTEGGSLSGSASGSGGYTSEPFENKRREMKSSAKANAIEQYKKNQDLL